MGMFFLLPLLAPHQSKLLVRNLTKSLQQLLCLAWFGHPPKWIVHQFFLKPPITFRSWCDARSWESLAWCFYIYIYIYTHHRNLSVQYIITTWRSPLTLLGGKIESDLVRIIAHNLCFSSLNLKVWWRMYFWWNPICFCFTNISRVDC